MKARRRKSSKNPPRNPPPGGAAALRRWYAGKAPVLRFGLAFCALTALFYLILLAPACQRLVSAATVGEARLSGAILNLIGQHNSVEGAAMLSRGVPVISVAAACSGFDFLCFFSAAVLVFPAPFARKIAGLLIGIPLLMALNLVRIMSLYFVKIHYPRVFDMFHEELWAIILIVASIILYVVWVKWAGTTNLRPLDAAA